MSRATDRKAQQAPQALEPRTSAPEARGGASTFARVVIDDAGQDARSEAETLRRSLEDCANLTREVCDWLEAILTAAIQNIGPEPGRQIRARSLLDVALHHVERLGAEAEAVADAHGITVGQEGRS